MVGMEKDTEIGGPRGQFPQTRRSLLVAVQSEEPEERRRAFETLVSAYWKPVYKYIRIRWRTPNEDAKDQTQEFFTRALEKGTFGRYDPAKAGFRTYLRRCLDGFLANEYKASQRLKRGGGELFLSLDFATAEGELRHQEIPDGVDLDEFFHQEWVRSLFELAVAALKTWSEDRGKTVHFRSLRTLRSRSLGRIPPPDLWRPGGRVFPSRHPGDELSRGGAARVPTARARDPAGDHRQPGGVSSRGPGPAGSEGRMKAPGPMRFLGDDALQRLREATAHPDLGDHRYRILEEIGSGGMGTVYRARDLSLDRFVALKVLREERVESAEDRLEIERRLRKEAKVLARLEHPGIVPIHRHRHPARRSWSTTR